MTVDPPDAEPSLRSGEAAGTDEPPGDAAGTVEVDVRPTRVLVATLVVIGVLLAAYAGGTALRRAGHDGWNTVPLTDMNHEMSVPTWFAAALLAAVAVLFLAISLAPPPGTTRLRWRVLAAIGVALSIDDVAAYHESWVEPVRNRLDTSGFLLQAWVIPGMLFVLLVALSQVGFIRALPRPTAIGLCLGAAVFVAGALGMEMVGAKLGDQWRTDTVGYEVLVSIEETLEMLGTALVIFALLRHIADHGPRLLLRARS